MTIPAATALTAAVVRTPVALIAASTSTSATARIRPAPGHRYSPPTRAIAATDAVLPSRKRTPAVNPTVAPISARP
jgi:hypothetical protein